MFKGIGNLGSILKQAQQIGSKMQEMNERMRAIRATGNAGGGLVEAEVNGLSEVLRISIDPSLIDKKDRELIEDLVPAAINAAQVKAKEQHAEAMKELTGGLNLPGLDEAMNSISGQSDLDERPEDRP